jgi:translation initiation factor IF-3
VSLRDALRLAEERGLDLVEVAPQARPIVCRIMDFGKYKYEQSKREREARKKQRIITIKEVKLRPGIEEHDFQTKARNAVRFIQEGDKVKVTLMFRGREIVHPHLGQKILKKLAEQVEELAVIERTPKLEGRNMIMILAPRQNQQ